MKAPNIQSKLLPELSVIVPILNDSAALNILAKSLNTQKNIRFETIVVDGSNPESIESLSSKKICEENGLLYFRSDSGRGRQMNMGRSHAKSNYFLFLHADSECGSDFQFRDAVDAIKIEEEKSQWVAGHFRLRFQSRDPELRFMLGFLERKSKLNRKNSTNGDQGLLISREFFDHIEGFSEQLSFLEDQIIVNEIRKDGGMFTLPHPLFTSARRFEEEGFVRRYYLMMIIMGAYHTQTRELFDLAPPLYVNQDEAGKLDMRPFFETIAHLHKTIGLRRSVEMWSDVGTFVRENFWQASLFADYVFNRGKSDDPILAFYDQHLSALENEKLDKALGLVAYLTVTKTAPTIYKSLRLFRNIGNQLKS